MEVDTVQREVEHETSIYKPWNHVRKPSDVFNIARARWDWFIKSRWYHIVPRVTGIQGVTMLLDYSKFSSCDMLENGLCSEHRIRFDIAKMALTTITPENITQTNEGCTTWLTNH